MLYSEKVTQDFTDKVTLICSPSQLNFNPDWLMYVMNNETAGTFDPSIRNPNSTATGLIQFLESTAANLGTTTVALAAMTAVQQLDYVQAYFANIIKIYGPIQSVSDCYLAVFYPAAIQWTVDKQFPDNVYTLNKVFDIDNLGKLTKQDFIDYVTQHYSAVNTGNDDYSQIPQVDANDLSIIQKRNIVFYTGLGFFVVLCIILIYLEKKQSK